jgi:hypothetical protein
MSALEELWHWLQGRSSRTEAGPDTMESVHTEHPRHQVGDLNDERPSSLVDNQLSEAELRSQRNWRYRAGPWQMK